MTIRYSIIPVESIDGKERFYGRVITGKSLTQKDLVRKMKALSTTVSTVDMIAVLEALGIICEDSLLEGYSVKVNKLVTLSPTIKGVFENELDHFDPKRHKIQIVAAADVNTRKTVRQNAKVNKVEIPTTAPSIKQYFDYHTNTADTTITSGNLGTIIGKRLKINPELSDESFVLID